MSVKIYGRKQIEILTKTHHIYLSKESGNFIIDCFDATINNNEEAHLSSDLVADIEESILKIKELGVNSEQVAKVRQLVEEI